MGEGVRVRMPRAQRAALMLEVAEELFAERGYQAASMDEIAARVGVTKPMLYNYFGSKEGLFLACLQRARTGMREAILAGAGAAARPDLRLHGALVAWFRFVDEHRTLWNIIEASVREFRAAADQVEAIRDEHTGLIAMLLAQDLPGDTLEATELEVVAAAISGVGERIARWRIRHPGRSPERSATDLMHLLWNGLAGLGSGELWQGSAMDGDGAGGSAGMNRAPVVEGTATGDGAGGSAGMNRAPVVEGTATGDGTGGPA